MIRSRRRYGLSLIELLVVLAIIGLLIGLTLSGVQKVRASAARTRCLNNLRQLSLGLHQYHDRNSAFPAGFTPDDRTGSMRLSWHARILPYIEQDPLWQSIPQAYSSDPSPHTSNHPPHRAIQRTPVPAFYCPSDPRPQLGSPEDSQLVVAFTSYQGVIGTDKLARGGTLFLRSSVKMTDIRDGTSNTLLLGERPPPGNLLYGWWYGGVGHDGEGSVEVILGARELNHSPLGSGGCPYGPYSFREGSSQDNCSRFHFWSPHPGGAHFAFADGSVRFLRYSADDILPALATRAGGEAVAVPE